MHDMPPTPTYMVDDLEYEAVARHVDEARAELDSAGIAASIQCLLDEANRILDPYGFDPVRDLHDLAEWLA